MKEVLLCSFSNVFFIIIMNIIILNVHTSHRQRNNISFFHFQNKHLAVEPIDFENFILKNKTLIQNDPQRELLLYPTDDVSVCSKHVCLSDRNVYIIHIPICRRVG